MSVTWTGRSKHGQLAADGGIVQDCDPLGARTGKCEIMLPAEPAADARDHSVWQQVMTALSEGLCPAHGTGLVPLPAPDGYAAWHRIVGYCARCGRFWGANLDTGTCGLWAAVSPHTGQPAQAPGWMGLPG
jgi:hypothetical protein